MSDVPHSYEAESAVAVSAAAQRTRALPNGVWGMLLLIATEATIFGTLIASYFYLHFQTTAWPPHGIEPPSIPLPAALTAVLVATSVPVYLAARAARDGRPGLTQLWFGLAAAIQCGYLAVQIVLYLDDLSKFSPKDSAYGSIYFTLLMVHHVHVVVGILLELWFVVRLFGGLTTYRLNGIRATSFYWFFVNAAAVFVVLTQLSPSF
jgi:heme/copper-type cytochrome/quinol oxidase subunit 3